MAVEVDPDKRIGALAWVVTVAVAASWQLATRFAVTTTLTPVDLAVLRYCLPAVMLLPVLVRRGFWPGTVSPVLMVLIIAGGGLPFGLLGMAGAQFAPASHMGAIVPGSMPIFVTLLSAIVFEERFDRARLFGLGAIILGVGCVVGAALTGIAGGPSVVIGDALFGLAGASWAVYTVAYRKSGVDAWYGAALICFWSAVLVVPVWAMLPGTQLLAAPIPDVALQVLAQGVLAGIVGLVAYGAAIRHLGASLAAVSGAAVPALTALGGIALLGEPLTALTAMGIVLVAGGLWAYAGAPGLARAMKRFDR